MNKRANMLVALRRFVLVAVALFVFNTSMVSQVSVSQASDSAMDAEAIRLFPFYPDFALDDRLYIGNSVVGENSGESHFFAQLVPDGTIPSQTFNLDGLEVIEINTPPVSLNAYRGHYAKLVSDAPVNALVTWNYDSQGRTPGMVRATAPASTFYLGPLDASQHMVTIHLQSSSMSTITGTVEFIKLNGSPGRSPDYFTIQPNSKYRSDTYTDGPTPRDFLGMVRVTATGPLAGVIEYFEMPYTEYNFIDPANQFSVENATTQSADGSQQLHTVLVPRLFRLYDEGHTIRTSKLFVGNVLTSTTNITATLHPLAGESVVLTTTALGPLQSVFLELAANPALSDGVYAATIVSDQPVFVSQFSEIVGLEGSLRGAYGSDAANQVLLPRVDRNAEATSIVSIQSTGCVGDTQLNLDFLRNGSDSVHTESITLPCEGWTRLHLRDVAELGEDFGGALHITQGSPAATVGAWVDTYATLFSPNPDGYGFENHGVGDISWQLFADTFGAEQTEVSEGEPKLFANLYYENSRDSLQGGLCFGMASTSLLMQQKWLTPTIAANSTYTIPEPPVDPADNHLWLSSPVSDFLAKHHLYQQGKAWKVARSEAWNHSFREEASLLVNSLFAGSSDARLITLVGPNAEGNCESHTLVPEHGSRDVYSDRVDFGVYDPNHPGAMDREFTLGSSSGIWAYDGPYGFWTNGGTCLVGGGQGFVYTNTFASESVSLLIDPPTPIWPVYTEPVTNSIPLQFISVDVTSTLLIRDAVGNAIGNRDGYYVQEIAGSYLDIPLSGIPGESHQHAEQYVVSSTLPLTVSMQHIQAGDSTLSATLDSNRFVMLKGQSQNSDVSDHLLLHEDATRVTLETGFDSPNRALAMGLALQNGERLVTIDDFGLPAGQVAEMAVDATLQTVTFTTDVSVTYQLILEEQSNGTLQAQGEELAHGTRYEVNVSSQRGTQVLEINWASPQDSTLAVDEDADGEIDKTTKLSDFEPKDEDRISIPLISK